MFSHKKFLLGIGLSMALVFPVLADQHQDEAILVGEESFECITDMIPVRGFYVASLTDNLSETILVANSSKGGKYPPGSIVQLIPGEAMVKRSEGTNPITHDWEFFELDVDENGTKIRKRGYSDVTNRFGGNCFGCHVQAKPQWDLVCENNHGCQSIPLTDDMIRALQLSDPRCNPPNELGEVEKKLFKSLAMY